MQCDICTRDAIIYRRYSGEHLCSAHFIERYHYRVRGEFRKQCRLRRGDRLLFAVSGGKDSLSLLYSMHEILHENRGVEFHVVTIDEGIHGYRPGSIPVVRSACKHLGVEFHLIRLKDELGLTMDDIAKTNHGPSPCAFCGVLRRKCMNSLARDLGVRALCVGLNADDVAQSVFLNVMRNDLPRLLRMAPHIMHQKPGLIPRVVPLRTTPENEDLLYVLTRRIKFHDAECPYYMDAMRNLAREFVNRAEDAYPGTKLALGSFANEIKQRLLPMLDDDPEACSICGEPCSKKVCKGCEIVLNFKGKSIVSESDTWSGEEIERGRKVHL